MINVIERIPNAFMTVDYRSVRPHITFYNSPMQNELQLRQTKKNIYVFLSFITLFIISIYYIYIIKEELNATELLTR